MDIPPVESILSLQNTVLYYFYNLCQTLLVFLGEAAENGTVDIEYSDDFSVMANRKHDLGFRCAVTCDVTGEFMNIFNANYAVFSYGGSAHTFSYRNMKAGSFTLKGSKMKFVASYQIESGTFKLIK